MEITLKNLQKKIPIPSHKILKAAKAAFRKLKLIGDVYQLLNGDVYQLISSLSIVFVGAKRMRAINKKYLKHDYVTDVLTFDLGEGVAEIIICPQIAHTNAKTHQTSTEKEIILYTIHGILHLAGFDDHSEKDIIEMRRMEKKLL
jgi:probable rRNA maturation factor